MTPLRAGESIPTEAFAQVRRRMVLDACKWDPQVGDVTTLADFPLILRAEAWRELQQTAERLADEMMRAERELLGRPDLHAILGISLGRRRALRCATGDSTARVLRFDFHFTPDGWRISEVNSDVPGGYGEASDLPMLMAEHVSNAKPAGHPGETWASAIGAAANGGRVALLAAPGFMEDQQVIAYLAARLQRRGLTAVRASPPQLRWTDGQAYLAGQQISAVVRFVQAEWLSISQLRAILTATHTAVLNSPIAMLTESKRFPLVWNALQSPLPTWRSTLPTTIDPREIDLQRDTGWLLKSAFCNTGDTVAIPGRLPPRDWRSILRTARWQPRSWIAQRQFQTVAVASPLGEIYPCIGVYTVNGVAAGIYGRISPSPVIDFAAIDVAVLIADSEVG